MEDMKVLVELFCNVGETEVPLMMLMLAANGR
jgi:hypothetical protein